MSGNNTKVAEKETKVQETVGPYLFFSETMAQLNYGAADENTPVAAVFKAGDDLYVADAVKSSGTEQDFDRKKQSSGSYFGYDLLKTPTPKGAAFAFYLTKDDIANNVPRAHGGFMGARVVHLNQNTLLNVAYTKAELV